MSLVPVHHDRHRRNRRQHVRGRGAPLQSVTRTRQRIGSPRRISTAGLPLWTGHVGWGPSGGCDRAAHRGWRTTIAVVICRLLWRAAVHHSSAHCYGLTKRCYWVDNSPSLLQHLLVPYRVWLIHSYSVPSVSSWDGWADTRLDREVSWQVSLASAKAGHETETKYHGRGTLRTLQASD